MNLESGNAEESKGPCGLCWSETGNVAAEPPSPDCFPALVTQSGVAVEKLMLSKFAEISLL